MLTSREIQEKPFRKAWYGYSPGQVRKFLAEAADCYEKLYQENLAAKERIALLSEAVKQYKAMEETLQNALQVAQAAGDEIKKNAYDRAELILKDAETKAAEVVSGASQEVARINYQYEEIKRSAEVFRAKVVSLLNAQLDIIKEYSEIQTDPDELQVTEELPRIKKQPNGEYVTEHE